MKRLTATDLLKRKAEWEARPPTPIEIKAHDKVIRLVLGPCIERTKEFLKEKVGDNA